MKMAVRSISRVVNGQALEARKAVEKKARGVVHTENRVKQIPMEARGAKALSTEV